MKALLFLAAACAALTARAETYVGVRLFDMYKVEAVSVMTTEDFRELRAELAEEKRVFNKALQTVKRDWTKQYNEARKAGDKDFPKYPTKAFIWPRSVKTRNLPTKEAADEWLAKQQARVDADHAALAAAQSAAAKSSKGSATAGYKDRDDKKARRQAEKAQLDEALKEKLGEAVELQMMALLKYNRPVPRHYVVDPIAGATTASGLSAIGKKIAQQEEALKAYKQRKAEAEAAGEAQQP